MMSGTNTAMFMRKSLLRMIGYLFDIDMYFFYVFVHLLIMIFGVNVILQTVDDYTDAII